MLGCIKNAITKWLSNRPEANPQDAAKDDIRRAFVDLMWHCGAEETADRLAMLLVCACFEGGFGDAKFTFENRAIVNVTLEKKWARDGVLERKENG